MPSPDAVVRWPDGTEATWEEVERGEFDWMSDDYEIVETYADPDCEGCGGGDKVPPFVYWRCPVCDSEWEDEMLDPRVIDEKDSDASPL